MYDLLDRYFGFFKVIYIMNNINMLFISTLINSN